MRSKSSSTSIGFVSQATFGGVSAARGWPLRITHRVFGDDRTVVIEMLTPSPNILQIMGGFQVAPLHGPSFAEFGAGVFIDPAHVATNGAYLIKEVVPQSHVLLEKNPNYWDAANVHIPFVKYHVTEDVATELKRYEAGEIDIHQFRHGPRTGERRAHRRADDARLGNRRVDHAARAGIHADDQRLAGGGQVVFP